MVLKLSHPNKSFKKLATYENVLKIRIWWRQRYFMQTLVYKKMLSSLHFACVHFYSIIFQLMYAYVYTQKTSSCFFYFDGRKLANKSSCLIVCLKYNSHF